MFFCFQNQWLAKGDMDKRDIWKRCVLGMLATTEILPCDRQTAELNTFVQRRLAEPGF